MLLHLGIILRFIWGRNERGARKVNVLLKCHLDSGIPKFLIRILSDSTQVLLSEYLFVPGFVLSVCHVVSHLVLSKKTKPWQISVIFTYKFNLIQLTTS